MIDTFCANTGMNATVAVNMFARAVLREKRIPFEIAGSDDPFYSIKNQTRLSEAMEQLESGGGTARELIEVEDD
jgi:DNA-damage-inducible protein J